MIKQSDFGLRILECGLHETNVRQELSIALFYVHRLLAGRTVPM